MSKGLEKLIQVILCVALLGVCGYGFIVLGIYVGESKSVTELADMKIAQVQYANQQLLNVIGYVATQDSVARELFKEQGLKFQ